MDWDNQFSTIEFYTDVIKIEEVKDTLIEIYGEETYQAIVEEILINTSPTEIWELEHVIYSLFDWRSECVNYIPAWGGYGDFGIEIMKFGPMYWIQAAEFDPICFFKTSNDAYIVAESNYCEFIDEYKYRYKQDFLDSLDPSETNPTQEDALKFLYGDQPKEYWEDVPIWVYDLPRRTPEVK